MSSCKNCTKRNVTADYNCHSHCQAYIKEKLTRALAHKKAIRLKEEEKFHIEVLGKINRKYGNKQIW